MIIVHGGDDYLLKIKVDKIIQELTNNANYEINNYNYYDLTLSELLIYFRTLPMFSEKKLFIINDCFLFSNETNAKHSTTDLDNLLKYLLSPNLSTEVVWVCPYKKLETKSKLLNEIIAKHKIYSSGELNENILFDLVTKRINSHNIKFAKNALDFFIAIVPNDLNTIMFELDKLSKLNCLITEEVIKSSVKEQIEYNIFQLVELLLDKKYQKFWNYYFKFKKIKWDYNSFVGVFASSLVIIKNMILLQHDYDLSIISEKMGINKYRLQMLSKYAKLKNLSEISDTLKTLDRFDLILKQNNINNRSSELIFDFFVLKIIDSRWNDERE